MPLTPDQFATLVIAVGESVAGARDCLEAADPSPIITAALSCLRAAVASITALALETEGVMESVPPLQSDDEGEVDPIATTDPSTCQHPNSWDLLGQVMCETCGATRISLNPEVWEVV